MSVKRFAVDRSRLRPAAESMPSTGNKFPARPVTDLVRRLMWAARRQVECVRSGSHGMRVK